MKQLTEQEAIAFYDGRTWEIMNDYEIVAIQIYQECLCVPFERFHGALETVLKRPIFVHEMGLNWDGLVAEYERIMNEPKR